MSNCQPRSPRSTSVTFRPDGVESLYRVSRRRRLPGPTIALRPLSVSTTPCRRASTAQLPESFASPALKNVDQFRELVFHDVLEIWTSTGELNMLCYF